MTVTVVYHLQIRACVVFVDQRYAIIQKTRLWYGMVWDDMVGWY
jgi:hypothetical protein